MKNKTRKKATVSLVITTGVLLTAFQNFTPHNPFAGQDTRDIYMSDALTQAVKNAEENSKKRQPATHLTSQTHEEKGTPQAENTETPSIEKKNIPHISQ